MKNWIRNWDLRRLLYLIGGVLFLMMAFKDQVWWIGLFGVYFISISVFRKGCATGNCHVAPSEDLSKTSDQAPH